MHAGFAIFPTSETPPITEIARMVEDRGFESLHVPEHTHIPASRETPYPAGGDLPPEYARMLDPFVALAAAGAVTERLKLATGVCLVAQRDPIVTAKAAASVDALSGGRLLFGVGAGWNREEMRNHGTDPRTRFSRMREAVAAIKAIWTQEEASFHGRHFAFERIWCEPKPEQRPHPPVLIGGNGRRVLDRVLAYGDGWYPNFVPGWGEGNLLERVVELRERAGRHVEVTLNAVRADPDTLAGLAEAGIDRVTFYAAQGDMARCTRRADRVMAALDAAGLARVAD